MIVPKDNGTSNFVDKRKFGRRGCSMNIVRGAKEQSSSVLYGWSCGSGSGSGVEGRKVVSR